MVKKIPGFKVRDVGKEGVVSVERLVLIVEVLFCVFLFVQGVLLVAVGRKLELPPRRSSGQPRESACVLARKHRHQHEQRGQCDDDVTSTSYRSNHVISCQVVCF